MDCLSQSTKSTHSSFKPTPIMRLKSLKNPIGSVPRSKTRERVSAQVAEPTPGNTSTAIMLCEQLERPLASARDVGIFVLFGLPPELVQAIISEMVNTVGFYRAARLRLVNRFFNTMITDILFSEENAHLLPSEKWWPTHRATRIAFVKVLETKIHNDTPARSTLNRAINACIGLLESLQVPQSLPKPTNHRQIYKSILCASTVNVVSMSAAIRHLSARDQTVIDSPLKGALTLASALGDVPSIEALIAQGACVDDESAFFWNAIKAAGQHGKIDAVKVLLIYSEPNHCHIYGAIDGGHKDIMQLFLREYYAETSTDPYGADYNTSRERQWMIEHAASCDQTALIDILLEYFPPEHRRWVLKGALYAAVQFYAMSTITLLLEAGVNITRLNKGYGSGLNIASSKGELKIVKLLIEHGFYDLNSYSESMHIAAVKGHTDIVQLFLDHGVDVNCRFGNAPFGANREFWDGMSEAAATTNPAKRGDFHMFCFLVRRGARVDVDVDGELGSLQQQWLEQIREWEAQSSIAE